MIQGVMGQVMSVLGGAGGQGPRLTIAQFLLTMPDYSYVEGESFLTDLLMTLARHLTFQDMVQIVGGQPSRETLAGLQQPLDTFIRQRLLQSPGEVSLPSVTLALTHLLDSWLPQLEEAGRAASVRQGINFPETLHNFLANRGADLVMLVLQAENQDFSSRLGPELKSLLGEAAALCLHCFTDQSVSLDRVVENRLSALTEDVGPGIRDWTVSSALYHLRAFTGGLTQGQGQDFARWVVTEDMVQGRREEREARQREKEEQGATATQETQQCETVTNGVTSAGAGLQAEPMEVENSEERLASRLPRNRGAPAIPPETDCAVPASFLPPPGPLQPGTGLPQAWADILARDTATLTEGGRQQPFSEAYLAGQPAKRRKLVADKKPARGSDIKALIAQSLQEAVSQAGAGVELSSGVALEEVVADTQVIKAAESVTKAAIQERVDSNSDFEACKERFPATERFHNK